MLYKYYAYKLDKQVIAGTIDAGSEQSAEEALYQSGYKYVLDLQALPPRPKLHQLIPSLFGVKNNDVVEFARQLAAFLESGSSLHISLELLKEQNPKTAVKALIADLISKLEQGSSFSQAIRAHPQVFPHSFLEVIESCEKTGELEKGLLQIAGYLEQRAAVMEKIRRAVAYPFFVICLAIGVCVLMVTTVMPSIVRLLDSFHADLPPVTVLVLGVFNFVINFKYQILAVILGTTVLLFAIYKLPGGRKLLDMAALMTPVLGNIIIMHNLGMFCRTAAILLKSGLPLPNIMEVAVRSASGNRIINQSLQKLKDRLMQGEGLAIPVSQDKMFPAMMVKMIAVGEQTGTLEESLDHLANYYQEYTRKQISTLVALIEPALTILIGIFIAILMISIIIPIYKIMGAAN